MNTKMLYRAGMLFVLVAVFCAAAVRSSFQKDVPDLSGCLGVPILTEEEAAQMGEYRYHDYSEDLKYQKEHVAVDKNAAVLYISQKIGETTTAQDLNGNLTIELQGRKLYFAPDSRWDDLAGAVRDGYGFRLLVGDYKNTYMEYRVVFTTLPVVYLYGQFIYKNENLKNVMYGRSVICDPEELGGIHTNYVQWNVRGQTSSREPKKPYKLALKDKDGKSQDVDLFGLGADDDWILNPMNMEDSNIREKLFMDLWNEMSAETPHNYPMSQGQYAEVIINGEYCGLYLIQRRIDDKYLALENAALLKGNQELVYEVVTKGFDMSRAGAAVDAFFYDEDCTHLNRDNFVDVSVFMQLFAAEDNKSYKNMYYVFAESGGDYSIHLIPWDTDLAMGAVWDVPSDGFVFDYEASLYSFPQRRETEAMQRLHPDLSRRILDRWMELRKDLLTEEHVFELMDGYLETLDASGAVLRDQEKWGLFYGGEDTIDTLYRFVSERMQILDWAAEQ